MFKWNKLKRFTYTWISLIIQHTFAVAWPRLAARFPPNGYINRTREENLGKKLFNLSSINNRAGWRVTRNRITNTFLSATSSQAQPHFWLFYLLPTSSLRVWGMGLFIMFHLCHYCSLTFLPCSSMKFLPQDIVLHKLLQYASFLQAAVLKEQLHHFHR